MPLMAGYSGGRSCLAVGRLRAAGHGLQELPQEEVAAPAERQVPGHGEPASRRRAECQRAVFGGQCGPRSSMNRNGAEANRELLAGGVVEPCEGKEVWQVNHV